MGRSRPASFPCQFCGVSFTMNWLRRRHERSVHQEVSEHVCFVCRKAYSRKDSLKEHVKKFHGMERRTRRLRRRQLGAPTAGLVPVRSAISAAAGGPYLCTYCGVGFSLNWLRTRHEKCVHEKRSSTMCPICLKVFTRGDNMHPLQQKIDRLIQQNEDVLRNLKDTAGSGTPEPDPEQTSGPVRTRRAFNELNEWIHRDPDYARTLSEALSRVTGDSPRQRVRNMLASVATILVLNDYTLRGSSGKRSFVSTPIYRLITAAARDVNRRIIDSEIHNVLRYGTFSPRAMR
ncbi:PR domain zinc finger protein 14 [Amphibalanus amphitrite]|uniref:PR domain zinc finger protein 14 n=1 Tax=Amphibalanus amphitrite TaxID=1232801 RepID=A0A6A4VSZ8_AMPAM|nr:PR domain zinc finger protein 14 [Amphibalanus amphitrite]